MADLHIPSFSQRALVYGLSTNFLYPSNSVSLTPPIENPSPSLKETVYRLGIDILNYTEKGWLHQCGRPVRVVARIIYAKVVYTIISPMGVAYHGTATIYYGSRWAFVWLKGEKNLPETAQKTQGHAWALLSDSFYTCLGLWSSFLPYLTYLQYLSGNAEAVGAGVVWSFMGEFFTYGHPLSKTKPIFFEWSSDQKNAFLQSLFVRNELGLVGKKNGLLPTVKEDIETPDLQGVIGSVLVKQAEEALGIVKAFNLGIAQRSPFISSYQWEIQFVNPTNMPFNFLATLMKGRKYFLEGNADYDPLEIDEMVDRLNALQEESDKVRALLRKFFEISEMDGDIPDFPIDVNDFNQRCFVTPPQSKPHAPPPKPHTPRPQPQYAPAPGVWNAKAYVKHLFIVDLTKEQFKNPENYAIYIAFKKGVLAEKSPADLLGLKAGFTQEELNRLYKKWAIALHPDSMRVVILPQQAKELGELFTCLGAAKDFLSPRQEAWTPDV